MQIISFYLFMGLNFIVNSPGPCLNARATSCHGAKSGLDLSFLYLAFRILYTNCSMICLKETSSWFIRLASCEPSSRYVIELVVRFFAISSLFFALALVWKELTWVLGKSIVLGEFDGAICNWIVLLVSVSLDFGLIKLKDKILTMSSTVWWEGAEKTRVLIASGSLF